MKECIREIVKERLTGMMYEPDEVPELCRTLADTVKEKVKSKSSLHHLLVAVFFFFFRLCMRVTDKGIPKQNKAQVMRMGSDM